MEVCFLNSLNMDKQDMSEEEVESIKGRVTWMFGL